MNGLAVTDKENQKIRAKPLGEIGLLFHQ